jgi:hypothetical protein
MSRRASGVRSRPIGRLLVTAYSIRRSGIADVSQWLTLEPGSTGFGA